MLSPREGGGGKGGRVKHGSLIVRSVPRLGILIVCNVPRLAILIIPPLLVARDGNFEFFKMKMSKSPPHAQPPLPGA